MAELKIVQEHSLSPAAARTAAEQVAQRLAAELGLACKWDGDVLRFERSGVDGDLRLEGQSAALRHLFRRRARRRRAQAVLLDDLQFRHLTLSFLIDCKTIRNDASWKRSMPESATSHGLDRHQLMSVNA